MGDGKAGAGYLHAIFSFAMKDKILAANARYTAQATAFFNELAPVNDEALNRIPADGGWSAMQVLHHLILVEQNALAYVRKKLSYQPVLEKSGLLTALRMALLRVALISPIKFKAPRSAAAERIPEAANFADTRALWDKARADWTAFLEQMPDELNEKAVFKHPRAGRLSWVQTLEFLAGHFARHQRQVRRALGKKG